tara:strand:+ start:178 stop:441 length:264 start_codon:yes stop_codon:yes gene_type:complete
MLAQFLEVHHNLFIKLMFQQQVQLHVEVLLAEVEAVQEVQLLLQVMYHQVLLEVVEMVDKTVQKVVSKELQIQAVEEVLVQVEQVHK